MVDVKPLHQSRHMRVKSAVFNLECVRDLFWRLALEKANDNRLLLAEDGRAWFFVLVRRRSLDVR